MNVVLHIGSDVSKEISELILNHKLGGGYSIDYAKNTLISFYEGNEIDIFKFSKYFVLDNRWCGYKIEDYGTKIVINFI